MERLRRLNKNYYDQNIEEIFNGVDNPNFKQFKVIYEGGLVCQNKEIISSPKKLSRLLNGEPKAVYNTVAYFLNPVNIHGRKKRPGYAIADNLFLWSDLFFDFDSEKDLKIAQGDTIKVLDYMKNEKNYVLVKIQFSATKGFHLIYTPIERIKEPNPLKRMELYMKEHGRIAEEIKKLELKTYDIHHYNLIKDPFRVYAVTHSIKLNSGNKVTPLTEKEIRVTDIYSILQKKGLKINIPRESKDDDSEVAVMSEVNTSAQPYREEQGTRITSPHSYNKFHFIDNAVWGIKDNYITIIKQNLNKFNKNILKTIQKDYKLSDFYVFKVGNDIYSVNFKCVQYERLMKILSRANSSNLGLFRTRKHIPLPVSEIKDENGDVVDDLELIDVVKSDYGLNDNHSLSHSNFLKVQHNKMVGINEIKIGIMRVV